MSRFAVASLVGAALILTGQVYPPMVGGDFVFAVLSPCPSLDPQGVPLVPPGLSVGIEPEGGGTAILCIETPACDTRAEGTVKITAAGQRSSYKGRAFTQTACVGEISDPSVETAYVYPGMKPGKPNVVQ